MNVYTHIKEKGYEKREQKGRKLSFINVKNIPIVYHNAFTFIHEFYTVR